MVEHGLTSLREVVQHVPLLLPQRRHRAEHSLHKSAPLLARRPVAPLPPQHYWPQRSLRRVVRRLYPIYLHEGPQRALIREQLLAGSRRLAPALLGGATQQAPHFLPHALHLLLELRPRQRPVPHKMPVLEHLLGLAKQRRATARRL